MSRAVSLKVAYSPIRIGFLIKDGDFSALQNACKINTCLWGGIFNPIIPYDTTPNAHKMIRYFSVDVLHVIGADPEMNEFARKTRWLWWPDGHGESRLFRSFGSKPEVDVLDVISAAAELKRSVLPGDPVFINVKTAPGTQSTFGAIAFGMYPEDLATDYTRAVAEILGNQVAELNGLSVRKEVGSSLTPIGLTAYGLKLSMNRMRRWADGVYIGESGSFEDLVNFWNLRASGLRLTFLPTDCPEKFAGFVDERLKVLPSISAWLRPDLSKDALDRAHKTGMYHPRGLNIHHISRPSWVEDAGPCQHPATDKSTTIVTEADDETNDTMMSLPAPSWIRSNPVSPFQQVAVTVAPIMEHHVFGRTFSPPNVPEASERYGRMMTGVHPWGLRPSSWGIRLLTTSARNYQWLRPINVDTSVHEIMAVVGATIGISLPGKISRSIIEQMGGLEGCRVFQISGVRRLLSQLGRPRAVGCKGALTTIHGDTFGKFKSLYIAARNHECLTPIDVLQYLLGKGVLDPGLELECSHCGLESWIPIEKIGRFVACAYCGSSINVSPLLTTKTPWKYRLGGVFQASLNHEGSIPVVLALLQLNRLWHEVTSFVFSTAVEVCLNEFRAEVDLVVIWPDSDGVPSVILGECKSMQEISEDDVKKVTGVASRVSALGLPIYMLFSKTDNPFVAGELKRFKELVAGGNQVILFTSQEIESYEPYMMSADADRLPERYARTPSDMAANSVFRYLS